MKNKKLIYTIIAVIIIVALLAFAPQTINQITNPPSNPEPAQPPSIIPPDEDLGVFCGESTFAECNSDTECIKGGCFGQICQSINEELDVSVCEYAYCYDDNEYKVSCGCISNKCRWFSFSEDPDQKMSEKITLTTSDNVKIIGDYFKTNEGSTAVLLLHMMPSTKESYSSFGKKLNSAAFSTLAIDLRGHGESLGGPSSFQSYTNEQHQKSIEDVITAIEYLKQQGHSRINLVGASIGANLALQYLINFEDVQKAILLSPGLNYVGIETIPLAEKISNEKSIYIVASKDDGRSLGSADQQGQQIFDALQSKKEIKIFETGGHGTTILENHPEFMNELIEWLGN